MTEAQTVELLVERLKEALENAPGPHVTPETAGLAVNRCLGCGNWDRGCKLYPNDVEAWIDLLITPSDACQQWKPKPPPKV